MKTVKDQNNVSLFVGDGLELTAAGLIGPGWTAPGITTSTHTVDDIQTLPADWIGGHYYHIDGEWTRTAIGQAEIIKKQADENKKIAEKDYTNLIKIQAARLSKGSTDDKLAAILLLRKIGE